VPDNFQWQNIAIKVFFDLSFFIIVTVIGLNIIFGIIVDTFSELRDERYRIVEDMQSVCFICGLPSYDFDRKAAGFEYHVKKEHNMWGYLLFSIYLANKDRSEYTAFEGNFSFFLSFFLLFFFWKRKAGAKAKKEEEE